MGQMDFISSIVLDSFSKLSGKFFADHTLQMHIYADQSPLLVHPNLIDKQWRHTDSDQRIYQCAV